MEKGAITRKLHLVAHANKISLRLRTTVEKSGVDFVRDNEHII